MMNQDQYHASLLNKGQPVGLGWDGITKASKQKIFPQDPPNSTDIDKTIKQVKDDDPKLTDLNWNNIKVCKRRFPKLCLNPFPLTEHFGREIRPSIRRAWQQHALGNVVVNKRGFDGQIGGKTGRSFGKESHT